MSDLLARARVERALVLGLLAALAAPGCFVSFDGYHVAEGGQAGSSGSSSLYGGSANGGRNSSGGAQQAGASSAGQGSSSRGGSSTAAEGGAGGEGGTSVIPEGGEPATGGSSEGGNGSGGESGAAAGGKQSAGGGGNGGTTNRGGSAGASGSNAGGRAGGAGSNSGGSAGINSGGNTGQGGAGGSAGSASCPINLPGPVLVEVPLGTGFFCIDRTEVTNADYAAFLAATPSPGAQPATCAFNASFEPETGTDCRTTNYDPVNRAKTPVSCVDWCDAAAYCAWAGKHLCGAVGGGANPPSAFADATKSEWYRACSHAGEQDFPYGNSYAADACIGLDSPYTRAAPVPTASCQGGYEGIYDLSGNLAEWEDSCSASSGASDTCLNRGGSYLSSDVAFPSLRCNSNTKAMPKAKSSRRDARLQDVGFRCCFDP